MIETQVTALSDAKVGNAGIVESIDLPDEVAGEPEEPVDVADDRLQARGLLGRVGVVDAISVEQVPEQLGVADDRRQRRTELVGDRGERLGAERVHLGEPPVLVSFGGEQPLPFGATIQVLPGREGQVGIRLEF